MLLLSEFDIERLIDPVVATRVVSECFRKEAEIAHTEHGRLDVPRHEPKGSVLVLAGHARDGLFAAKTNVHVYPEEQSRRRLAQSMLLLWNSAACEPLALLATTAFNNHRTGAGLAAAADVLAAKDAKVLVIFGAGKVAPATIRYIAAVRSLTKIYIFGHGQLRARELADAVRRWPTMTNCLVTADADVDDALREADIVVTVTTSSSAVFSGTAVKPGALVILAGANRPDAREGDDTLIARAQVYADDVAGSQKRAGDIINPMASGVLQPEQLAGAIGLAISGKPQPRPIGTDITIYKSMGIIEQDIALAALLLDLARHAKLGLEYDPKSGSYQLPDNSFSRPSVVGLAG